MSHVYSPVELRQSPAYSNKFVKNRTITIATPQMLADYTMTLPPDIGTSGKYLRTLGPATTGTEWSDLTIKMMTSVQIAALTNVEAGTIVYDTTVGQTFIYNGTAWVGVATGFSDATFRIMDDLTPTKQLAFQCASISPATTRTITMADRDLDLDTPVFSTVDLLNGANSVTLASAVGTAAYTITTPAADGLSYQVLRKSLAGDLEWEDSFISTRFGIFDAITPANILSFITTSMTAPHTITMADRDINLATPTFETVTYIDTVSANTTTIQPFSGLGASYNITLPDSTTLPAVGMTYMLTTESTGVTSWSNTVSEITTAFAQTIAAPLPEGYSSRLQLNPTYDSAAANAIAIHNYIRTMRPLVTGLATVTNAAVFEFDDTAANHEALDAAVVDITAGGPRNTTAWIKVNINGTLGYIPVFGAAA